MTRLPITNAVPFFSLNLSDLQHNWVLVWTLARREIRGRYAASIAGTSWTVLGPALTIMVFLFVFSGIMMERMGVSFRPTNYALYLCTGIVPWSAFQEALHRSNSAFLDNANLIKHHFFAREILIAQTVLVTSLNLLVGLSLVGVVMAVLSRAPGPALLFLPLAIAVQIVLSFGLGLLFSTLNVMFRDLSHTLVIGLHMWFWLTPIVYPAEIVPSQLAPILELNPVTTLIGLYRASLLDTELPGVLSICGLVLFTVVILIVSVCLYKRLSHRIVDEV